MNQIFWDRNKQSGRNDIMFYIIYRLLSVLTIFQSVKIGEFASKAKVTVTENIFLFYKMVNSANDYTKLSKVEIEIILLWEKMQ